MYETCQKLKKKNSTIRKSDSIVQGLNYYMWTYAYVALADDDDNIPLTACVEVIDKSRQPTLG